MIKKLLILITVFIFIGCGSGGSSSVDENQNIDPLFQEISVGFGSAGGVDFLDENNNTVWLNAVDLMLDSDIENTWASKNIYNYNSFSFYNLQKYLKNSKFLVYWLTESWDESWFDINKIQSAIDKGYIPVFNYWYFGDGLTTFPTDSEIENYYENVKKVSSFLSKLKGKKLLILEPEFNKNSVISSEENAKKFALIISNAIDTIKNENSDIFFSLCMADTGSRGANSLLEKCGYDNCALGDKYEWNKTDRVYKYLYKKLDFLSFQEMVGQFSRNPQNPGSWDEPIPISYTKEDLGIEYLSTRISNMSKFLYDKYKKPVFLPYIAIASGVWSDSNGDEKVSEDEVDKDGWNEYISLTYKNLRENRDTLLKNGLFGYAPMALFDHPRHDYGGYQYFMQNEYHLGLINTGAKDEVNAHLFGDLMPKGSELLNYIFAPIKDVYEKNVNINKIKCEAENGESCQEIATLKLNSYYDMTIEKTEKEKNSSAILIPLYSYPNWYDSDYVWQKLIDIKNRNLDKRVVAIINPSNGHFSSENSDYIQGLKDLIKANIEVVGYVYTSYGSRSENEIFQDIDNWSDIYKLYGIRGIFFDETSTDESKLGFYITVSNYAKSKGFYFNILNPGITTEQIYVDSGVTEIIVTYENDYASFKNSPPTTYNEPSILTSLAFLVYEMDGNKTNELYDFSKGKKFDYFYVTEDNDSNPWDSVSEYLEDEITILY
jgi:hypothetical protein